ncbi:MAG: hypothetical protein HMLKMBBP_02808 [Planctomycetes bacterium]|nr:hypothetical protein [Planctomycetota bacterium]
MTQVTRPSRLPGVAHRCCGLGRPVVAAVLALVVALPVPRHEAPAEENVPIARVVIDGRPAAECWIARSDLVRQTDAHGRVHWPLHPDGTAGNARVLHHGAWRTLVRTHGVPGPSLSSVEFTIGEPDPLRVVVREKVTARPAVGVRVRVSSFDDRGPLGRTATTDESGVAEFRGLRDGEFNVTATTGGAAASRAYAIRHPQAAPLVLELGEPTLLELRGVVRDAAGRPLSGALIAIDGIGDDVPSAAQPVRVTPDVVLTRSGRNGEFSAELPHFLSLAGLSGQPDEAELVWLRLRAPGGVGDWRQFTVRPGPGTDLRLSRSGTVRARVRDPDGGAVGEVLAWFHGDDRSTAPVRLSATAGTFGSAGKAGEAGVDVVIRGASADGGWLFVQSADGSRFQQCAAFRVPSFAGESCDLGEVRLLRPAVVRIADASIAADTPMALFTRSEDGTTWRRAAAVCATQRASPSFDAQLNAVDLRGALVCVAGRMPMLLRDGRLEPGREHVVDAAPARPAGVAVIVRRGEAPLPDALVTLESTAANGGSDLGRLRDVVWFGRGTPVRSDDPSASASAVSDKLGLALFTRAWEGEYAVTVSVREDGASRAEPVRMRVLAVAGSFVTCTVDVARAR